MGTASGTFIVPKEYQSIKCFKKIHWSPSMTGLIISKNKAGLPRPVCPYCLEHFIQEQGWVMESAT